jgi:molybdopterin converting factor small subunit
MMEVQISIHGPLAGRVIRLNTRVTLPDDKATLTDLLVVVGQNIGVDILTQLDGGKEFPVILLSGENLELPAGLEQPLQDGDEVTILQAIAGG